MFLKYNPRLSFYYAWGFMLTRFRLDYCENIYLSFVLSATSKRTYHPKQWFGFRFSLIIHALIPILISPIVVSKGEKWVTWMLTWSKCNRISTCHGKCHTDAEQLSNSQPSLLPCASNIIGHETMVHDVCCMSCYVLIIYWTVWS